MELIHFREKYSKSLHPRAWNGSPLIETFNVNRIRLSFVFFIVLIILDH